MSIYCGNNRNNKNIISGEKKIGTRYSCLKSGFGLGYYKIPINSYENKYVPIDTTKIYCGNSAELPPNYDRFGTLRECHSKGVGIGLLKKYNENEYEHIDFSFKNDRKYILEIFLCWVFTSVIIGVMLYFKKPKFILNSNINSNINSKKNINYILLILYSIFISSLITTIIYVSKYNVIS